MSGRDVGCGVTNLNCMVGSVQGLFVTLSDAGQVEKLKLRWKEAGNGWCE